MADVEYVSGGMVEMVRRLLLLFIQESNFYSTNFF